MLFDEMKKKIKENKKLKLAILKDEMAIKKNKRTEKIKRKKNLN